MDTVVSILKDTFLQRFSVITNRVETGSEKENSFQIVGIKFFFYMRETVEHLGCTLGISNILYFVYICHFFHHLDVGRSIIKSHLRPAEVPVSTIRCAKID